MLKLKHVDFTKAVLIFVYFQKYDVAVLRKKNGCIILQNLFENRRDQDIVIKAEWYKLKDI